MYVCMYIYILICVYVYIYIPYWLFPIGYSLVAQIEKRGSLIEASSHRKVADLSAIWLRQAPYCSRSATLRCEDASSRLTRNVFWE